MQYLFVASGGITVFILTLILGKRDKIWADYILSGILFILLINFITLFVLNESEVPFPIWKEVIFEFSEGSIFIYGPLLWLYTKSLTKEGFKMEGTQSLHFVPFLLAFGYFLIAIFTPIYVLDGVRNALLVAKLLSILIYTWWSLNLLEDHQRKIQFLFSNLDRKKLDWLRFLCWSIIAIGFIASVSLLVDRYTSLTIPQYGGMLTNTALCVFVYALGYFGFKQEFIFQPSAIHTTENTKYAKSGLDPDSMTEVYQNLVAFVETKKPYLDPELTLFGLAEQFDLPANHLSQIINSSSGSNFYDFINQYRVEKAKEAIKSDTVLQLTLLGIGMSCGFSSKSTFNRAFKKHTGQTPSAFKASNENA